jgi:hypothetical protein
MEPSQCFGRIDSDESANTRIAMGQLLCSAIKKINCLAYLRILALPLFREPHGACAPIEQLLSQFLFQRRNESGNR